MAATSHDFWLHNLGAPVWKRLHILVYAAYTLLIAHVTLGALQSETSPLLATILGVGLALVLSLHVAAALQEQRVDRAPATAARDGFVEVAEALTDKRRRRRAVVTLLGACGTRFAPTSKLEEHLRAPRPFRHAPLTFFGSATSRRWTACARSRSSR